MRNAFITTLTDAAEKDERIWLLTGDLGFSVLEPFIARFPERFVNAGVAEQNMVGVAAGLAMTGKRVFVYSIANFAVVRCLEQIRNDICYHNLDVKIVSVGAGFSYGAAGYTHQGIEETHMLRTLPNIDIIIPADPVEASLAMNHLTGTEGPAYLRLSKGGDPVIHNTPPTFERGAPIPIRSGGNALLIASGTVVGIALEAAALAEEQGREIAVWSMPWLSPIHARPFDAAIERYPIIGTVEEARDRGGLGSAVAERIAEADDPRPHLHRFGISKALTNAVGSRDYLLEKAGITPRQIVERLF